MAGRNSGETAAAINWVVKDGAGRLGRFLFARWSDALLAVLRVPTVHIVDCTFDKCDCAIQYCGCAYGDSACCNCTLDDCAHGIVHVATVHLVTVNVVSVPAGEHHHVYGSLCQFNVTVCTGPVSLVHSEAKL